MATGHYSLEDLRAVDNVSVIQFDENRVNEIIRRDLEGYNRVLQDITGELMVTTTERVMTAGASGGRQRPKKLDEYGRASTQRQRRQGQTFGLPLESWGDALGWTRDYLMQATPADLANQVLAIQDGDTAEMYYEVRNALFNPANYTFYDYFTDNAELNVKRLYNADSSLIPNAPDGTVINGATHTHYLASATLTAAAIDAAIATVREHGHAGRLVLYINENNQGDVEALPEFRLPAAPLLQPAIDEQVATIAFDNGPDNNRIIGVWRGRYLVATKPWVPANYLFVYDTTGPKPLAMRVPAAQGLQGLRLVAQFDAHPLRADHYEHRYGLGCFQRSNGSCLFFANATYTAPDLD